MIHARLVRPEWLDHLPADDPQAQRSRRDLRRIHFAMASVRHALRALDGVATTSRPATLVDLGAGDGSLMLRIARRRASRWPRVRLTLLDRQPLVAPHTLASFEALGWDVDVVVGDVFAWLERRGDERLDLLFASLFVHHFEGAALARLLSGIARRTQAFVCIEPRRSAVPLLGSHMLGWLGANAVTRHDALASVRAGFAERELSAQWPERGHWLLREHRAGLFGHRFVAVRGEAQRTARAH